MTEWMDRLKAVADEGQRNRDQDLADKPRENAERVRAFGSFRKRLTDELIPGLQELRGELAKRGFNLEVNFVTDVPVPSGEPGIEHSFIVSGGAKGAHGEAVLRASRSGTVSLAFEVRTATDDLENASVDKLSFDVITADYLTKCVQVLISSYLGEESLKGNTVKVLGWPRR